MTDDLYAGDDSSGLLNHYVGRVKTGLWSTFFAETQGKASGDFAQQTLLFWHVDVLDILQANYEAKGAPVETNMVNFGIGNGWHQDPINPNLVEHEDDTDDFQKKFHGNSGLMSFVYLVSGQNNEYEGAVPLDGDGDLPPVDLQGVRTIHAQRGIKTLRDATIWNGLIFEFRGIGYPSRNNPKPKPKTMPFKFMGYEEGEITDLSSITQTNNSAGAQKPGLGSPSDTDVQAWRSAGASDPTVALLTRLHESSPTLDHFKGNAKMVPDVKDNEVLVGVIEATEPF